MSEHVTFEVTGFTGAAAVGVLSCKRAASQQKVEIDRLWQSR